MGKTYRRSKRYFEDDYYENDNYSNSKVTFRKEKSQEWRKNRPKRSHEDPDLNELDDENSLYNR